MVKKLKSYNNFKISNIHKNSILLVGNFDGLHLGHQKLFNLAKKYKKKFKLKIGGDSALAEFFMRHNSRECRILFMHHLSALNIPIRASHLPRLRIWVNGANYKLPITPKFQQNYLNEIANTLWPNDSIGTREHLQPPPLTRTFDQIGRASLHG